MRDLKGAKAAKGDIDAAVKELLNLKAQFKAETGTGTHLTTHTFPPLHIFLLKQYHCGSVSVMICLFWIRIRVAFPVLDPDPATEKIYNY